MTTEPQLDLAFSSEPLKSPTGSNAAGSRWNKSLDFSAATTAKTLQKWLEHYVGQRSMYLETAGEMPALQQAQKDSSSGLCWTRNLSEWNHTHLPCRRDGAPSTVYTMPSDFLCHAAVSSGTFSAHQGPSGPFSSLKRVA